ncbi:MAG: type II toxin-antitoxin system VapC family toxin [Pirellulales bacterium]
MSLFVDTSAMYAVMDASDACHARAARTWADVLRGSDSLITTNYVLVEVTALIQSRLGLRAVQLLARDVLPAIDVTWVDETCHRMGMAAVLGAGRRRLSLVDCVSFEVMNRLGIKTCFVFDTHFRDQGFQCIPN